MPDQRSPAEFLPWLAWVAALWIAWEFLHYEQYKLTGHPGSVFLFTVLTDWLGLPGHEKAMRLSVAIVELMAVILVLIPRTQGFGGLLAAGIMGGAIFFHVASPLGIDPYEDGGVLFREACVTLVCGLFVAWVRRDQLWALLAWVAGPRRAAMS